MGSPASSTFLKRVLEMQGLGLLNSEVQNQNQHQCKMQRWFLCILNFGKHCPRLYEHTAELPAAEWHMSYSCAELTIFSDLSRASYSLVHSKSQEQPLSFIVMPCAHLICHKTPAWVSYVWCSHRKYYIHFIPHSHEKHENESTILTIVCERVSETWANFYKVLPWREMSCKCQMIPPGVYK